MIKMTPLKLQIILHYYAVAEDFRSGDFSAPAVRSALPELCSKSIDLMALRNVKVNDQNAASYKLTPRGRAYVEFVLKTPLPLQQQIWVLPEDAQEEVG